LYYPRHGTPSAGSISQTERAESTPDASCREPSGQVERNRMLAPQPQLQVRLRFPASHTVPAQAQLVCPWPRQVYASRQKGVGMAQGDIESE